MEIRCCRSGGIANAEVSGFTNKGLGMTCAQQQKQSSSSGTSLSRRGDVGKVSSELLVTDSRVDAEALSEGSACAARTTERVPRIPVAFSPQN